MNYLMIILIISFLTSCITNKTPKLLLSSNLPPTADTILIFTPIFKYLKHEVKQKGIFSNEQQYTYHDDELEKFIALNYTKWVESTFINFKREKDTTELYKARNYFDSLHFINLERKKITFNAPLNNYSLFLGFEIKESQRPINSYYYTSGSYNTGILSVKVVATIIDTQGYIVYQKTSSRWYDSVSYRKYPKKMYRHLQVVFKDFLKEYEKGKR